MTTLQTVASPCGSPAKIAALNRAARAGHVVTEDEISDMFAPLVWRQNEWCLTVKGRKTKTVGECLDAVWQEFERGGDVTRCAEYGALLEMLLA